MPKIILSKEAGTMEIKGIGGMISAYKPTKAQAPKKSGAAVSVKNNTDRVEFGFETALINAKAAIAQEVRADASLSDLRDAQNTAQNGAAAGDIAAMILMG